MTLAEREEGYATREPFGKPVTCYCGRVLHPGSAWHVRRHERSGRHRAWVKYCELRGGVVSLLPNPDRELLVSMHGRSDPRA